ncbi:amino acid permease [Planosporangium flavigriseum]|uniref:Amino acid permease n=1 Tax=Planosporangium flavigriseum TaxID=373681 RepID=A0A8J3LNR4_9ACTN|nr:APC family permease [Planosporangium flavigriseum]NJC66049.1 amino acid permease [Planosporangium flavigriseum]GIG75082.1 amino acid permease [Planosporangium flavigriseum]
MTERIHVVSGGAQTADSDDLASHGYRQRLNRSLGSFSSFAAGFSYISILTGMFQLFGFGYGFGGPLLFWAWLLVLGGQFCVALVFGELGARYPIAGSVYQWSKQVSSRAGAWFAGWMMLVGSIVSVAAVAMAEQIVLPAIWSGFEVFDNPAVNAVLLASVTIAITTIINVLGVKVMAKINNVGVIAELVGVILILVLLAVHIRRGPQVVLETQGAGPGLPGWGTLGLLAPILLAAIMPAYVMYGFDTASSLAEETKDPRRRTPIAILQALAASGAAGALLLILALMSTKTLSIEDLSAGGLPMILQDVLGSTLGKLLLVDVAFAIFVCTLAIQTAAIRVAFSMARDHRLPFGERLAHVTEERHSPAAPSIVSGVIAIGILLVNLGNAKIFTLVTSVAIIIVYIAYLMVTLPVFRRRLGGWPADRGRTGLFTLGRGRGLVINGVAVAYGLFMTINLIWPRELIYGEGVYAWGGVIVIAVIFAVGALYYFTAQHRKDHVIASEHRVAAAPATAAPAPIADGDAAPAPALD